jgi:hypothetical protein
MLSFFEEFAVLEDDFTPSVARFPHPVEGLFFTSAFKAGVDYYIMRASFAFVDHDGQCSIFSPEDFTPIPKNSHPQHQEKIALGTFNGSMTISRWSRSFATAKGTFYQDPEGIFLENFYLRDFRSPHCNTRMPLD